MKVIHGILAIAIVFLYACGGGKADKSQTVTSQDSTVLVKVQLVSEQPVEQLTELTGNIEACKVNNIAPTIPGRIDNILVEVGDRVQKGQLLVQMDKTNLVQAQLQLANAERELGRVSELYKSGSATQQQFDQLTSQVDVARESVRNLTENTELHSPIDGVITARTFDAKNIYSGVMPILTVMQVIPVKVIVSIPEIYFPQVKTGTEVRVRLDVYPDKNFTGRINIIYPTIDQLSRTFKAEVSITNTDMAIRPGMFARVELNFGTLNRVVVPDLAVIKQPGTNTRYVFTVENGLARRRELQLGRLIGNRFEVISGIDAGAQVVIAGQSRLLEQTPVRIDLVTHDLTLTKEEIGAKMVIENILFNTGETNLLPESLNELNKLVNLLRESPNIKIEVSGHTDNTGSEATNKTLSNSRALSVRNYLVSQGISGERIGYNDYGFDRPIASNNTEEGRAANRRVEIKILD